MSIPCGLPGCDGEFVWAQTRGRGKMPVDAGSAGNPGGTLAVWQVEDRGDGRPELRCRVITAAAPLQPGEYLGTQHWATCKASKEDIGKVRRR